MNYVFLDFDGYIAKSYYASISKDNTDKDEPMVILNNLVLEAEKRAAIFFNSDDIEIYPIVSGHTFKKDIFPGYKGKRKRDEGLGKFRDEVKANYKGLVIAENLEADDLITFANSVIGYKALVFSDDKDLRKYNPITCRLNPTEEVECNFSSLEAEQCVQMITGDTIDCIKGIPRKGEVWARKYLDKNGYTLQSVIKAYKDNNVDIDECLKNLAEVIPVCPDYINDLKYKDDCIQLFESFKQKKINTLATMKCIEGFLRYLSDSVKEVYYEEKDTSKKS
ncbi:MAG: hypothetical protein II393_02220 [Cytophagales bacterium]|nr:hypothetical protein [Cytophagales bacterium]